MAGRAYEPGEITALGEAIYHERVLSQVGPVDKGTFVVIDVETGDYELDARDATATRRLLSRRPTAVTYAVRVGHRAAYSHIGGFRIPKPLVRTASGILPLLGMTHRNQGWSKRQGF